MAGFGELEGRLERRLVGLCNWLAARVREDDLGSDDNATATRILHARPFRQIEQSIAEAARLCYSDTAARLSRVRRHARRR